MSDKRWNDDNTRVDGVRIMRHPHDANAWIIVAHEGASVDECPCCGKPMISTKAARLVADIVYPVRLPAA